MRAKPEYVEGPEAWQRFQGVMKKVIAGQLAQDRQLVDFVVTLGACPRRCC
jgi:hypothetical protein